MGEKRQLIQAAAGTVRDFIDPKESPGAKQSGLFLLPRLQCAVLGVVRRFPEAGGVGFRRHGISVRDSI